MARPVNFTTIYLDSSALLKAIKNEDGHEHVAAVLRLVDLKQITVFRLAGDNGGGPRTAPRAAQRGD